MTFAGCRSPVRVVQAAAAAPSRSPPVSCRVAVPIGRGGGAILALLAQRRGKGGLDALRLTRCFDLLSDHVAIFAF